VNFIVQLYIAQCQYAHIETENAFYLAKKPYFSFFFLKKDA